MPLRIVHMTPTPNGAPWLIAFMLEQKKLGHDVRAIIPSAEGDIAPKLDAAGIPYYVVRFDLLGSRRIHRAARIILSCALLLRRLRADVVQTHIFEASLVGRLAAWIADVPISISMVPGPLVQELPLFRIWDLGTEFADHKIVASCEYTRTLYAENGVDPAKLEMIYYAVDQSRHHPELADGNRVRDEFEIPSDAPVIGYMAYCYPALTSPAVAPPHLLNRYLKGHDVFIRAMPRVLEEFPDARFMLVGRSWMPTGTIYPQEIHDLVERLGLARAVIFTGERKDVPDVLKSFDISVHCSLSDNLGGTVESLLMARPMAVSDIGGFRDTVIHGKTGLRFPAGDHEALADALIQLLRDPERAKQYGDAGRAWMLDRFMLPRSIADLEDLYRRCASERTGGRAVPPRVTGYRLRRSISRLLGLPRRMLPVLRAAEALFVQRVPLHVRVVRKLKRAARRVVRPSLKPLSMPLRIAQVVGADDHGSWPVELGRGLAERGKIVMAVTGRRRGTMRDGFSNAGIPVLDVSFPPGAGLRGVRLAAFVALMPFRAARLARVLRQERVGIVQSHDFPAMLIGRTGSWFARCRHVSVLSSAEHLQSRTMRTLDRCTWFMDDALIASSDEVRQAYDAAGLTRDRSSVVYFETASDDHGHPGGSGRVREVERVLDRVSVA